MRDRQLGLTKTYNRFHDPDDTDADIVTLRALHVEMDQAVARAYGWTDLDLGHGFHETRQGQRYTLSEPARRTVLDRLLALNHERYAQEVAEGKHDKKLKKRAKKQRASKPTSTRSKPGPAAQTGFSFSAPASASVSASASASAPTSASEPAPGTPAAAILAALRAASDPLSKSETLAAADIPASQWNKVIQALQAASLIERRGKGRGTRYSVTRDNDKE